MKNYIGKSEALPSSPFVFFTLSITVDCCFRPDKTKPDWRNIITTEEYQELLKQAESGDAAAQFALGCHFDKLQEYAVAREWYERAAAQNHPAAWNNLAGMALHGEGRAVDLPLAAQYYRKAAKCGDEDGFYNCARTLEDLAATLEDWRGVIRLYRKCGRSSGHYNLGLLYEYGNEFIPVDHRKACQYYRLAAGAGPAEAANNLAAHLYSGSGCRKNWPEAFRYTKFAADHGDKMAYLSLGHDYLYGEGTKRNYAKAFLWFRRSWFATGGAATAGWLGECYLRGRGVKRNPRKAFLWIKRAAELGDDYSSFVVGFRLVSGDGGWPRDAERGRPYLERYLQAHPDDADTLYWLGKSYGDRYHLALPYFEKLWRRDRDPWSAYELVRLNIAYRKYWTPGEFAEMEEMLRFASRRKVFGAWHLRRSRNWRRLYSNVATSEELAAKYRRSLRRGEGCRKYLFEFHKRNGRDAFEACRKYLQSDHPLDVIAGADLLGQLGSFQGEMPFAEESAALLIPKLATAGTNDERRSLLRAVAWQHTLDGQNFLLRYVDDPDAVLRHIVAWGLAGETREELAALLKLAHDPELDVWDWAVYHLIDEGGILYPELEAGLTELAAHPEPLMRCQAIAALAARHAPNAEFLLRRELQTPLAEGCEPHYLEDAANYLNLPELLSAIAGEA